MNTAAAFAMGEANEDNEQMVFDWDKAARLIKESQCKYASAGLSMDWEWTGGTIFDGEPVLDSYTYLSSCWATPEIELDGIIQDCYKMQSEVPNWNEKTKWPQRSIDILKGD